MQKSSRLERFRHACQQHLAENGQMHKYIYWECMPEHLVGMNYSVQFQVLSMNWKDNATFSQGVFSEFDYHVGKSYEEYKETCLAKLKITFKTSILIPVDHEVEIDFRVVAFFSGGSMYYEIFTSTPYSAAFEKVHGNLIAVQNRFKLRAIESTEFQGRTAFSFYADILRKVRTIEPHDQKIQDHSFLDKISHAHGEVAVCVSNVLSLYPMTVDLTGRKISHEGDELFLPNIHYFDYQFFMWASFSFERLYTFWETLIVLLYNYDLLGMNTKKISFGSYFKMIDKKIKAGQMIAFPIASKNISWLQSFASTDYEEIVKYRHRIVHHEFTGDHEGLLSAKFFINAYENVGNKQGLRGFEQEIKSIPSTLIKHFNLCKEGFEKILLLIDELN